MRAVIRKVLGRPNQMTTYRERHRIASVMSMVPLPLPLIMKLFGTDKQQNGVHDFGSTYARLFNNLRYRRLKLLEIGVLSGASLLTWRAFFPFATTVGFDVEDKAAFVAGQRTRCYQGDQGSEADLANLSEREGPFDIIVDDGSHQSRHQILSFQALFKHLRPSGLYVIEDVQTSFWSGRVNGFDWDGCHIDSADFANTCVGWFLDLSKYVNHAEFRGTDGVEATRLALGRQISEITFAHNMIVVRKVGGATSRS